MKLLSMNSEMNWWSSFSRTKPLAYGSSASSSSSSSYNNYNGHDDEDDLEYREQVFAQFYLPSAKLECNSNSYKNDWLQSTYISIQGWRINQEDSHLIDLNFNNNNNQQENKLALFGVFDGHNGPEISLFASEYLPQLLKNNQNFQSKNYEKALEEVFMEFDSLLLDEKINEKLKLISKNYESINGKIKRRQTSEKIAMTCGTTAVVALVSYADGHVYVANIGDSRCCISLKNKTIPLTFDHKPTNREELQRIKLSGSYVENGRINSGLNLSRAFGDFMLKSNQKFDQKNQAVISVPDITVTKQPIHCNDFLVLACDGIWNCMNEKEVCNFIRKKLKKSSSSSSAAKDDSLTKICQEIIQKCISPVRPLDGQIGGDNMTCIIVRITKDLPFRVK